MNKFKIRPSSMGKIMGKLDKNGELPKTCTTYLKEWYADSYEEISSKYMTKGILMEDKAIDFMAEQLGYGLAEKNINIYSNEWCVGTPDVIQDNTVIDIKCSWSKKTLHDSIELNKDYEYQLRAYMWILDSEVDTAILFYALMNTPAEANYGTEVSYEHLPANERWLAFGFARDLEIEAQMKERVELCREWLEEFDSEVKKKLGKINK
jgi:hypothetical protein